MKNKMIIFLGLTALLLFVTGCAQKVKVKSIEPAKINDPAIKQVSIKKFTKDSVHLRESIMSQMDSVTFNNKKYFTIVNREDINTILKEQKLQDSGLVNNKGDEKYGLSDISSIISGNVTTKEKKDSQYKVKRTNYNECKEYSKDGKKCIQYYTYYVKCKKITYNLEANIKITKTSNADIILGKDFSASTYQQKCSDESNFLSSDGIIFSSLGKNIASDFVSFIAPSYTTTQVELLEDEDIDYSSKESKLLKNGLKLIELNDIQSANEIFMQLVESTKLKSETALYNLAVSYELLGMLDSADVYYTRAKNMTLKNDMNETIIKASKRIKTAIEKQKLAQAQIKK